MNPHDFAQEAPFPEGLTIAQLETISLAGLEEGRDFKDLFESCKHYGFFYLNLQDSEVGKKLLDLAASMFKFSKGMFQIPEEEKRLYDLGIYGYKGVGGSVVDKNGTLDRMESWTLAKDDFLLEGPKNPYPDFITSQDDLVRKFMTLCHYVSTIILDGLEKELKMKPGSLVRLHDISQPSGDQIRFIRCLAQQSQDRSTSFGEHTDFGSVTVLFNRIAGLRIAEPGKRDNHDWPWVKAKPGHAIINIGDALVKFTNGLFRSNIHRVDPPPYPQVSSVRYSLGYFCRPLDNVYLKRLEGCNKIPPLAPGVIEDNITSKEWLDNRFKGRRVEKFKLGDWDNIQGTETLSSRKVATSSI